MKSLILTIFLFFVGFVQADQLAWITEAQARKAAEFLRKQESILLFCGCCDQHDAQIIQVVEIGFEATPGGEYFEVFVVGVNAKGKEVKIPLDLAYVYFKKKKKAVNVGKHLGFECDVCTKPKSFLQP
jgi:hypothetical protein